MKKTFQLPTILFLISATSYGMNQLELRDQRDEMLERRDAEIAHQEEIMAHKLLSNTIERMNYAVNNNLEWPREFNRFMDTWEILQNRYKKQKASK